MTVSGRKEKVCEKRRRGYKRRNKMGPVNYVGDRNRRQMRLFYSFALARNELADLWGIKPIFGGRLIKKRGENRDWNLFPRMSWTIQFVYERYIALCDTTGQIIHKEIHY
jgi:hypothetical protein